MTAHPTPSPEAPEAARQYFNDCGLDPGSPTVAHLARIIDANFATLCQEHADLRDQNGRLKKALHVKSESEKALYGQLRIRNDMLEALTVYGWTVNKFNGWDGIDEGWWWCQGRGCVYKVAGPHDQLPPWPESARIKLAEQRACK